MGPLQVGSGGFLIELGENAQRGRFYSLHSMDVFLGFSRSLVPPWDLAMVLEGLKDPPFEQLQGVDVTFVSRKAVLRLALASENCVSDIHALSAHPCA